METDNNNASQSARYCSNCGSTVSGRFCVNCGQATTSPTFSPDSVNEVAHHTPEPDSTTSDNTTSSTRRRRMVVGLIGLTAITVAAAATLIYLLSGESSVQARTLTGTITGPADNEACFPGESAATMMNRISELIDGQTFPCPEGYGNVSDGAAIVVKDADGTTLATGTISDTEIRLMDLHATFTVDAVPSDEDFYEISAGSGSSVTFTNEELASEGWSIALKMG